MDKSQVKDLLAMQVSVIQTVILGYKNNDMSEMDIVMLCSHAYQFLMKEKGLEYDESIALMLLRNALNVFKQLKQTPEEFEKEMGISDAPETKSQEMSEVIEAIKHMFGGGGMKR